MNAVDVVEEIVEITVESEAAKKSVWPIRKQGVTGTTSVGTARSAT